MKLLTGVVRDFNLEGGFGFVRPDDPSLPECFAPRCEIQAHDRLKVLAAGQRVLFRIQHTEIGPRTVYIIPGGYRMPSRGE